MRSNSYWATGFQLLSTLKADGLRTYLADIDSIAKGDMISNDGTGYGSNAVTAMSATASGIAIADCDNSGGSKGDLNVQVIPLSSSYRWIVPVEANALITQAAVGTIVDLESVNTIDISDTTIAAGPGFFIDEIDVSVAAVAVNTYGYAIGHFVFVS